MSYPLSTFVTCISGIDDCTNNFTLNEDYIVSGKSCVVVLTSEKWFDVSRIITSKDNALDYFSIDTDVLSGINQIQINPYDNQPYLTGGNLYTNSTILCVYRQSVSACNVYEGIQTYIAEDWIVSPGGAMNLTIKGDSLQTLYLVNCLLSGISIDSGIVLSNLNSISFIDTSFIADTHNIMGNGINKFLFHLSCFAPNNGYFSSQNDLIWNFLNILGRNSLSTLTADKGWTVNIS